MYYFIKLKTVKLTYFLSFCLTIILFSCNQTKHVPQGKYLLKKNKVVVKGDKIDGDEISDIIRQQPNRTMLGMKFKLWAYNRETYFYMIKSDSLTIAEIRKVKNEKIKAKNRKKIAKQDHINQKRIYKARLRGDSTYYRKIIPLKDTVNPKRFFREWFKYKLGEPPVILDTAMITRSHTQIRNYLMKRGYYESIVESDLDTNKKNTQIAVTYNINTGKPFIIDSISVSSETPSVLDSYAKYAKSGQYSKLRGEKLDSDMLNSYKSSIAKFMRDEGYFGFSASHVVIEADSSNSKDHKADLKIHFTNKITKADDRVIEKPHQIMRVRDVYFHIADTTNFDGDFSAYVKSKGLSLTQNKYLTTVDTLEYREIKMSRKQKKSRGIDVKKDTLQPFRFATILYNGKPTIKPSILELQNYLEHDNYYKEYYLERSSTRFAQLNVFQTVKPDLREIEGTNQLDVHYYLVPSKKQSYIFEPRFTNSNGFLGVAASLNYVNKNLFRGSEILTISLGGGFESTPPVFEKNLDGKKTKDAGRSFNTFEFGPSVKLDLPGLFPTPATFLSKRQRPRTIISVAYNYQKRVDFKKGVFQLNYLYKFIVDKTQIIQFGLPFASVIKYIYFDPQPAFEQKLAEANDPFLKNTYSNQFIWEDFKITFEYNNNNADNKGKSNVLYTVNFDHAGLMTKWLSKTYDPVTDMRKIFGVAYSQFIRLDNEIIISRPIDKKKSLNFRVVVGGGIPYGNIPTSLPYDYAFFAGGSNDNRGWRARSLGPGTYKYYLDQGRTATQTGDIRIGGSAEFRFSMSKVFKGAFFIDAANIWTLNEDVNRPGSKFTRDFYKELAYSAGVGLRLDFSFFIVRLDLGVPISNPALPKGAQWIFQSRAPYYAEGEAKFGDDYKSVMPRPFTPAIQFGIGYPF